MPPPTIQSAARVVQLALTPVFLLSGIAGLMGTFSTRLGRVADQVSDLTAKESESGDLATRMRALRARSLALDVAVIFAGCAGATTCASVLVLFIGAVRGAGEPRVLFGLFGIAIVLTMCSLLAFVTEMMMAARSVRLTADRRADSAQND